MAARRRKKSASANYLVSIDPEGFDFHYFIHLPSFFHYHEHEPKRLADPNANPKPILDTADLSKESGSIVAKVRAIDQVDLPTSPSTALRVKLDSP